MAVCSGAGHSGEQIIFPARIQEDNKDLLQRCPQAPAQAVRIHSKQAVPPAPHILLLQINNPSSVSTLIAITIYYKLNCVLPQWSLPPSEADKVNMELMGINTSTSFSSFMVISGLALLQYHSAAPCVEVFPVTLNCLSNCNLSPSSSKEIIVEYVHSNYTFHSWEIIWGWIWELHCITGEMSPTPNYIISAFLYTLVLTVSCEDVLDLQD